MAKDSTNQEPVKPLPGSIIPELNGLRGIAVVAMLITHVYNDFHFRVVFQKITHLGGGVDIFFVLSGFLTTRILLSDQSTTRAKIGFYLRRCARLMPAYLLLLILVWSVWGAGPEVPWSLTYTYNYGRGLGFFLASARPLAHTWSLCVEEHFYLVWPWILWHCRSRAKTCCMAAITSSLVLPFLADKFATDPALHYVQVLEPTHARLLTISIGCLLALHEKELRRNPKILLVLMAALVSLLAVLKSGRLCAAVGIDDTPLAVSLIKQNLAAALIFSTALWASFAGRRRLGLLFTDKRLCGLGNISYGLYLYHFPIYWLFSISGPHIRPSQTAPWLALLSTFVIATLSNRYYEQPIRNWARQLVPRQKLRPADQPATLRLEQN